MPVTKVLVIYSLAQKVRRRLIKLDHPRADDKEFTVHEACMIPGEGKLYIPLSLYESFDSDSAQGAMALDRYIASVIGQPSSDRCAVITGEGNVIAVVCADPRIDDHPEGFLIQDDAAFIGGTYDFEMETAHDDSICDFRNDLRLTG